jgi:tRNA(Ile)-lysidine synthase
VSLEQRLREQFAEALGTLGVHPDAGLCLAVSGGLDSVAMLHVARNSPWGQNLHVGHIHHGLRGADADADAQFVHHLAEQLNLSCSIRRVDTLERAQRDKAGIEAAARALRYEALASIATEHGCRFVATAHTINDQAETVLMRILRGTGIDGLQGIRPRRILDHNVTCVRPLLGISRTELLDAATASNWHWREDSSNLDVYFRRNAIRHHVIPVLTEIAGATVVRHLAQLAALAHDTSMLASAYLAVLNIDTTRPTLDRHTIQALQPHVQRAVVHRWLQSNVQGDVNLGVVNRVIEAAQLQSGCCVDVNADMVVCTNHDVLSVCPRSAIQSTDSNSLVIPSPGVYETENIRVIISPEPVLTDSPTSICIDADSVTFPLVYRPWRDGDRLHVLNGPGTQLVSDILTNAHVPTAERRATRVLEDAQGIVWVCGHRIAHRVRRTDATTAYLTIQIIKP